MALEDMKLDRRGWGTDVRKKIDRYLRSVVGESWSAIHSKICSIAAGNTELGRHIRDYLRREVDDVANNEMCHYADYYVDEHGDLRLYPKEDFRSLRYKQRKQRLPIEEIRFIDDFDGVCYKLIDINQHHNLYYIHQKPKPITKLWFREETIKETYTSPVATSDLHKPWAAGAFESHRGEWVVERTMEKIVQRQVGGKLLKVLRRIVERKYHILSLKICGPWEEQYLMATVAGSSSHLGKE